MELIWHGHSTWHVVVDDTELLIDPYFDNPKTDVDPEELDPDYLLLTHGHSDHIGDVDRYEGRDSGRHPGADGVHPGKLRPRERRRRDGDEHRRHRRVRRRVGDDGPRGPLERDRHGLRHLRRDAGGFVVIGDKKPTQESDPDCTTFYHAGDTGLMSEMVDVIAPYLEPDAARAADGRPLRRGGGGPASPPTGWAPTWCS